MPEIFRDPDVVAKRLRMAIVPDFTALFLMSNGPEDEIGGVDLSDDNEASKDQLLGWLDFWSPGNHDDRTIAILY